MNDTMFIQPLASMETERAPQPPVKRRLRDFEVPLFDHVYLMLSSGLLAFSAFLPLFFKGLMTATQSQNAYIAQAFSRGQLPYRDLFSEAGFLYHLLAKLAIDVGGRHWLVLGQLLAFYVAGIYLYKLVYYVTGQSLLGRRYTGLFYLFNLAFGFGGFYPVQLAFPFLLWGCWLLVTYLDDLRRDEVFIGYGVISTLALALEPRTIWFWFLAFLVLSLVNIKRGRWARGFYQQLAMIFGAMLVAYPLGYLMFNLQILLPYAQQTLLAELVNPWLPSQFNYLNMGMKLFLAVCGGLVTGLILLPWSFRKMAEQVAGLVLLSLSTLLYLVLAILRPGLDRHDFLLVLPFALVLAAIGLAGQEEPTEGTYSRRRQTSRPSRDFLTSHLWLPLVVVFLSLAGLAYPLFSEQALASDRQALATYLATTSQEEELLVVWDNSAQLYLDSGRLSATQFPVATVNTQVPEYQDRLIDQLLQDRADYIVVNPTLPLPDKLAEELQQDYQEVVVEGVQRFKLFVRNN